MSTTAQWSAPISSNAKLRADLKQRRQKISTHQRLSAQQRAIVFLTQSRLFHGSKAIAAYISVKAEFPTNHLLLEILRRNKQLYLPVLEGAHQGHMKFNQLCAGSQLQKNRFGIPEPVNGKKIAPKRLDLVIMPLLGFDKKGHRLGMGGGYYDRTLAFSLQKKPMARPFLLGLAYDTQEVSALQAQPWDVPLNAVLTESGIRHFNRR